MVCAYVDSTYTLKYHGSSNHFQWTMTLASNGGSSGGEHKFMFDKQTWINIHGLTMWFAWSIGGLVQIISNRYFKHKYAWRQFVHTLTGLLMCLTVISGFTIVFGLSGWALMFDFARHNMHPTFGNATVFFGVAVTIGGLAAESLRRFGTYDWRSSLVLSVGKIHKVFGYLLICFSQVTISTGLIYNFGYLGKTDLGWTLIWCNLIFFWGVLAVFEILHRRTLAQEDSLRAP